MHVLELALPTPLRRHFDYLAPAGVDARDWPLGIRIQVDFARQTLVGILMGVKEQSNVPAHKLKPILARLDDEPCLSPELLQLTQFATDYYQAPAGEMLHTALPALLRQGAPAQAAPIKVLRLTTAGQGLPTGALNRAAKQAQLLNLLQKHAYLTRDQLADADVARASIKALLDKQLAEEIVQIPTLAPFINADLRESPLTLNAEQTAALEAISPTGFSVSLLDGVTGSGKTEVYLQAIATQLAAGRQVLVLVPEIGLTPQTLARFARRFSTPIVALHSGLNDRERLDGWLAARAGAAGIVLGTRSAIFTPMAALGLIIIDEEHDQSFKQQDGVRYSARDLAVMRAKQADIPLLMGSATPSLETLTKAQAGRYQWLRLTTRAGGAQAPDLQLVDTRGRSLHQGFAPASLAAIDATLKAGNQVLVFLNRRGYAPSIECQHCGWFAECRQCDTRFTVHQAPRHLHCHHCDAQLGVPRQCPNCQSRALNPVGQGTERSEETLASLFPNTPVIRVDRDSTRTRDGLVQLLREVNRGDPCILVGTQMLAKGHHFPDVTLVVVLDADAGLFSTDFRGTERMSQLLLQVAGRAGRAEKPGRVLIQTQHADHPFLQTLVTHGYHQLATEILRERQLTFMPPYRHLALVRIESPDAARAIEALRALRAQLEAQFLATPQLAYLGPLPSLMEKRGDRYRYQLQFNTSDRRLLQPVLAAATADLEQRVRAPLRWHIDVDPQEL